jgi:DNA-binding MarR family transcriptional regulator
VLFVLAHLRAPVTAGSLAATLQVTAGAVSQLLEPLRAAELVATAANPHDSRSRVLSLTEAARAEVERLEQRRRRSEKGARLARITFRLSAAEAVSTSAIWAARGECGVVML